MDPKQFNRTIFISDNLPFLKALDSESVDLVIIDPPVCERKPIKPLKPSLSKEEWEIERDWMLSLGIPDTTSAYELGLEYPNQDGSPAKFSDTVNFRFRVYDDWLNELKYVNPGADALIQTTLYTHGDSVVSYIAFMMERMLEIARVLKSTGAVYLHCEPTTNSYLRPMMDVVFGAQNFRNEIVWGYRTSVTSTKYWPRKHDTLLFYVKSDEYSHRILKERRNSQFGADRDVPIRDVWDDIKPLTGASNESVGYPSQKPQALAKRIIEASSSPDDVVMDCFAGCASVPVAAELTGRRWIACDVSPRAWTVLRRQFNKHPDLEIIMEDELSKEGGAQTSIGARRVAKLRGPNDIPQIVSDGASGASIKAPRKDLAKIKSKQHPSETREQIWEVFVDKWGPMCWYCGFEKRPYPPELHVDHIKPRKRDGSNDGCWNRALACPPCNNAKGNRLTPRQTIKKAYDAKLIATYALFNEQVVKFQIRHEWAIKRYNKLRQLQQ